MLELLSIAGLAAVLAGAALLFRATRCPRCRARAVRFVETEPWQGRDRCSACGWESNPYSVDL